MSVAQPRELSFDTLLQLRVGNKVLRVGQVCDQVLYLREVRATPPTDAELLITINGLTEAHSVYLPNGIDERSDIVEFHSRG